MRDVDQILRHAAEETRKASMRRSPSQLRTARPSHRQGWLVFAAAFAVVVVAFGLLPWLAGIGESPPLGGSTLPFEPAPPTTVTETTIGTQPAASCPTRDLADPEVADDLPGAVADTRDAVITAAGTCDFETLDSIAGEGFSTTFGGAGDDLSIWNDKGLEARDTLLELLHMRHATIPGPEGAIYVWPAAHSNESWEQVTEQDMDELARIHSEGELDSFASAGAYLGWRTGISENGEWMFFIAGD